LEITKMGSALKKKNPLRSKKTAQGRWELETMELGTENFKARRPPSSSKQKGKSGGKYDSEMFDDGQNGHREKDRITEEPDAPCLREHHQAYPACPPRGKRAPRCRRRAVNSSIEGVAVVIFGGARKQGGGGGGGRLWNRPVQGLAQKGQPPPSEIVSKFPLQKGSLTALSST